MHNITTGSKTNKDSYKDRPRRQGIPYSKFKFHFSKFTKVKSDIVAIASALAIGLKQKKEANIYVTNFTKEKNRLKYIVKLSLDRTPVSVTDMNTT